MAVVGVEVPVRGGADHRTIGSLEDHERQSAIRLPVSKRVVDPTPRLFEVLRSRIRKPSENLIGICCSEQAGCVVTT